MNTCGVHDKCIVPNKSFQLLEKEIVETALLRHFHVFVFIFTQQLMKLRGTNYIGRIQCVLRLFSE